MPITDKNIQHVKSKYETIADCLTEKERRLWAPSEAISHGYGGASLVSKAMKMSKLFLDSSLPGDSAGYASPIPPPGNNF